MIGPGKMAYHKGIRLQRKLGQHILTDEYYLERIITESGLKSGDHIFEVGAGPGNLTELLLKSAQKVVTAEIDERFREILERLRKKYPESLTILYEDVLKIDMASALQLRFKPWKVLANIPYYITSPLLELLLSANMGLFSDIYLTVQKDIALRICAGNEGRNKSSLSLFVDYYSMARILFDIPPDAFNPPPQVDSSFVHIETRAEPPVKSKPEKLFAIIRRAFNQRRKAIKNSLRNLCASFDEKELLLILDECNIDPFARPQDLSIYDFDRIALRLEMECENNR